MALTKKEQIERDNLVEKLVGEEAMKMLADYPLYASTSGITYKTAIELVNILLKNEEIEFVKETK